MSDSQTDVADEKALSTEVVEAGKVAIPVGEHGVEFETLAQVHRVATAFVKDGVAPKGSTPATVMAAILKGKKFGLDEVTSMTTITVINGRTMLAGALILALIRKSGLVSPEGIEYGWTGEGNTRECWVKARRRDEAVTQTHRFSMGNAATAGLANKDNYKAHPDDMLFWRCIAQMGRRQFPEIGMGVYVWGEIPGDVPPNHEQEDSFEHEALPPPPADPLIEELRTGDVKTDLATAEALATPPPHPATHAEADAEIAAMDAQKDKAPCQHIHTSVQKRKGVKPRKVCTDCFEVVA